jgi:hypothetical protein
MGQINGRGVLKVWQGVASGWIGKAAGDGGLASGALGVVTHFGIATCMAAFYALAARRFPILYRRWLIFAPLYGVLLLRLHVRVVLALRFGGGAWRGWPSVLDIGAHVGLALAAPGSSPARRGRHEAQRRSLRRPQDIAALRSALMVREHLGFRRASEVLGVNPSSCRAACWPSRTRSAFPCSSARPAGRGPQARASASSQTSSGR